MNASVPLAPITPTAEIDTLSHFLKQRIPGLARVRRIEGGRVRLEDREGQLLMQLDGSDSVDPRGYLNSGCVALLLGDILLFGATADRLWARIPEINRAIAGVSQSIDALLGPSTSVSL